MKCQQNISSLFSKKAFIGNVKSLDYPDERGFNSHKAQSLNSPIPCVHVIPIYNYTYTALHINILHFLPSHSVLSGYLVGGLTILHERVCCNSSISGEAVTSLDFACGFPGQVCCSSSVSVTCSGAVTSSGMVCGLVPPLLPST